jgi:hypothetical protein
MKCTGLVSIAFLAIAQTAGAASWSSLSITTTPENAPKVVAATEKLMGSTIGKDFPGKLLLQAYLANGSDPATHTFVPIYKSIAEGESFIQKMQADAAWQEFQKTMTDVSQPASQVLHRTLKQWGDIVDTDHVWMAHAFQVEDPPAFVAALDALMASPTGKKFPGQVYLSEVVAGGISPVTHVISVGYDSEAEMDSWAKVRDASSDWSTYLTASRKSATYLGGSLARDVKSWGAATLKDLTAP